MKDIRAKTKKEFKEKLYQEFSSPSNRDCIGIIISRWEPGADWHIYREDKTAIGKDRKCFIGIRAYDEEEKEYFFIEI